MAWPGGKDGAGVVQRLINEIPPHDVFVSAFLGDCALLRKIRPAGLSIGIDLDADNVRRWVRSAGDAGSSGDGSGVGSCRQLFCCDAVEWLRFQFGWYRVARSSGDGSGDATMLPAGETWFVYADPPYLMDTRKSKRQRYAHEMSDADHVRLLETLVWLPCLCMVSHYPCDLYDRALAGWRSFTFRSVTRGGGLATEKVWCNYPLPERLHDSRFLGRNKREREKIHRRVRRALGKVQRLPALERQAVLDALITGR
jgi:DNA adenine methylase